MSDIVSYKCEGGVATITMDDGKVNAISTAMAEALKAVEEAKEMAAGNVNPQLIVSGLTLDLRSTLLGGTVSR